MLSNLAAQTSYRFRVCAINSSGRGAWSDEVVLTTGTPKAPTDLLLLSSTATSLQIAWSGEPSLRSRHCTYTLEMNRAEPSADGELGGDWEEAYTGPSRTCRVKALKPDHSYRLAAAPCRSNPFFHALFPRGLHDPGVRWHVHVLRHLQKTSNIFSALYINTYIHTYIDTHTYTYIHADIHAYYHSIQDSKILFMHL
jgi:hypothetical protein